MDRSQAAGWLIVVGAVLFVAACSVPAVYLDSGRGGETLALGSPIGLVCLLLGWLPPATPFWLANPCYFIALVKFARGKVRSARTWAATACILSLGTMGAIPPQGLREMLLKGFGFDVLGYTRPTYQKAGYHLWLGAMLATIAAGFLSPVPDDDEPRGARLGPDHQPSNEANSGA